MNWIDINNELPEFDKDVLIFYEDKQAVSYLTRIEQGSGYRYVYFRNPDTYNHYEISNATHWMPLPDAPKQSLTTKTK